jgi:hypothetical protein
MPALRLTDQQLDAIHRAAWPLASHDRAPFLEAVAAKLSERPELLGDGHVARSCIEMQRRFLDAATANGADGAPRLKHGKYR